MNRSQERIGSSSCCTTFNPARRATTMTDTTSNAPEMHRIAEAIATRRRFVLSSHSRPDGDSIGSQLAMAYALRALGKEATVINSDAAPGPLMAFPGVPDIQIADRVNGDFDAAIIMECVDPVRVARNVYDSNNMGRLKLFGAVLSAMQLDPTGRIAIVYLDHEMARAAGGTYEDTEGLINLPLTVKEIRAVIFFKQAEGEEYRVSMRSKGEVDIGAVAKEFNGGGHKNAAGCTVRGGIDALQ